MVAVRVSLGVRGGRAALFALSLLTLACAGNSLPDAMPASAPTLSARGSGGTNDLRHAKAPHVVLISFDGFKPEYLDRFDLPNFRRAMARGTRAAMTPVFPSLTFPNHLSLVTGGESESSAASGAGSVGAWQGSLAVGRFVCRRECFVLVGSRDVGR